MVQYTQETTDNDNEMEEPVADWTPCPECGTPLKEHHEMRGEVGFWEVVVECPGCGYTETD